MKEVPKYKPVSLRYPGGKSKVAKKIVEKMPPHTTYVEPFAGAAHVFFKKPKAEQNVLNDKNRELIKFFKDIKGKQFCCDVGSTKEKFNRLKTKKNKTKCEQLYLNKNAYGGARTFEGTPSYGYVASKNYLGKKECVNGSKLEKVKLHTQDYKDVMKKYDSKDTLFYIDPPYVRANKKSCLYGKDKCNVNPKEVASTVKKMKGKAIISYDNHPTVLKAFKGFNMGKITLPYTFFKDRKHRKIKGRTKELLITNFKCKRTKTGQECKKTI